MHPQIVRDGPGRCPICGMALVQRQVAGDGPLAISLPSSVQQRMNLRVATVERGRLSRRIEAPAQVQVDESSLRVWHPRVSGWVGELHVQTAGESVRRGQRLFTLYSPELVRLQEEFLQALRGGQEALIATTRRRLELLDVQPTVIDDIARRRQPMLELPWSAPGDGYLLRLGIRAGMAVGPDTELLATASAGRVWVIAEVPSTQSAWIREGGSAEIALPDQPTGAVRGQVNFIYPEASPATRAVRLRIEADNAEGRFRPGDWARVIIEADPREGLVLVPSEAIIRTGSAERVIVQTDASNFEVRPVHIGVVANDRTEIRHGLSVGERVVVSGQFLIDSEASIRAGHQRLGGPHAH